VEEHMCGGVFTCRVMAIFLQKINRKNRKKKTQKWTQKQKKENDALSFRPSWLTSINKFFIFFSFGLRI
jgi:hypothetical protein